MNPPVAREASGANDRSDFWFNSAGFLLMCVSALYYGWTMQELSWSFWVASLVTCWVLIVWVPVLVVLRCLGGSTDCLGPPPVRGPSEAFHRIFQWNRWAFFPILLLACYALFYIYTKLFVGYGLFLSFFAAMEPEIFFGPNGFINSDFFSPVQYLTQRYWPGIVGTLVAQISIILSKAPLELLTLPISGSLIRLHVVILTAPFLGMLAFALGAYQGIMVPFVLFAFYYTPRSIVKSKAVG
jgi:hypothetical protein